MRLEWPGTRADHLRQVAEFPCLKCSLIFPSSLRLFCPAFGKLYSIPNRLFPRELPFDMANELTSAMTARSLRIVRNVRLPTVPAAF